MRVRHFLQFKDFSLEELEHVFARTRWIKDKFKRYERYWPLEEMKAEMHMHLDLTTQEAVARLQGDWAADVAAYDDVHEHILHMSDLLSDGIVKQFPARFH